MAFVCKKKLTHFLSVLCVSLCFAAVLRDIWLNENGIRSDSHIFRRRHFPIRHFFHALGGREIVTVPHRPPRKVHVSDAEDKALFLAQSNLNVDTAQNQKALGMNRNTQGTNSDFKSLQASSNNRDTSSSNTTHHEQKPPSHFEKLQKTPIGVNETDVSFLVELLRDKLKKVPVADIETRPTVNCNSSTEIGNSCDESGCLQLKLPRPLGTRIGQIVRPKFLQITAEYASAISMMADEIRGHSDLIIVSAISSNHYLESQAMLYNLHHNLFPHLKNFTFVYYNLGLKPAERRYLASICRCQMIDFPFHKFPEFVTTLKCYTWKPLIVNAVIQKANLVFWVDASIRFHADPTSALALIERTRERGIQMGWSKSTISKTTLQSMFHFFGDEACAYRPYHQGLSGVVIYHNEYFVRRAVLQPWAACALSGQCMCPQTGVDLFKARISCHQERGMYYYGLCHRFDQSALSILLTKMYQENIDYIILKDISQFLDVKRGDARPYEIQSDK